MQNIFISSIEGNQQLLDGGAMYGNAPKAVWERWSPTDEFNRIKLSCRSLLIETDEIKILCETGIGAFFEPKLAKRYGVTPPDRHLLLENLKNNNISQQDINYVILSHLHFDHAGGLLPPFDENKDFNELLFPHAKYIVGASAWKRAKNPHSRDRASFIPKIIELLEQSNRLVILNDQSPEKDLPTDLSSFTSFYQSSGHTPGQLHTIIKGKKQSIIFCGDLIPGTPWVHLPITMGYDRYPEQLIDEKKELYEISDLENLVLFFTHDPNHVASKVRKNEKGRYEAVDAHSTLLRRSI